MNKISLKIDVSKLDKNRFKKNSYTKKDGTEVNEVLAELDLVEKKEPRVRKAGEWTVRETHFIAERRGKDEESNYVGVGEQWDKDGLAGDSTDNDIIDSDSIPF